MVIMDCSLLSVENSSSLFEIFTSAFNKIIKNRNMKSTTLLNAPLVELVAELRWSSVSGNQIIGSEQIGNANIFPVGTSSRLEEFFMRFGALAAQLQYPLTERLIPPGFPLLEGQPVYRFRKQPDVGLTSLYQIGPGVFTANAVPPYKTWAQFSPVLEKGVRALLEARPENEKDIPFNGMSLRYIDAFGPEFMRDMDAATFIKDVLGIEIKLPDGLIRQLAPDASPKPSLQIQLPMLNGMIMNLGIGEGVVNNKNSIIFDSVVAMTVPVAANLEAVVEAMNLARNAIHDMFFSVTSSIKDLMKPQGGN